MSDSIRARDCVSVRSFYSLLEISSNLFYVLERRPGEALEGRFIVCMFVFVS